MPGLPMLDPLTVAIATGVVLVVFLRGSAHKIRDLATFQSTVSEYRVLPQLLAPAVSYSLVVGEVAVVAGLLWSATRLAAAGLAGAMLVIYGGAIAINIMRGRVSIDCGCGGPGSGLSWLLVIRNAAVAFLALMAAASVSSRELDVADFVVMILGVVTALVVLLGVEQAGGNGAYVWRERHRSR